MNVGSQPGRGAEAVALGEDVAAVDVGQRRAAAERHGELELVPEHPEHVPDARLALRRQREHHRPPDLDGDGANKRTGP